MISVKNLCKEFDGRTVLNNISIDYKEGECSLIIGASGSGKTVLLKNLVGLHTPDKGEIWYDDKQFTTLKEKQKKQLRKEMGMLFQGSALFDFATVEENIMFRLELRRETGEGKLLPEEGESGECQQEIPQRAQWRHAEACRYSKGHSPQSKIPLLRRAQLRTRPTDIAEDRRTDTRHHKRVSDNDHCAV